MAYEKIDERFIEEFTNELINHLSKPYDPLKDENAAQEMIRQAAPGDYGKISRIFDQLARLPCVSRQEFHERMAEAKSIEAYMKPIIDKVAELILTPDKSRLNDKVIKAIGIENYCRLVNGKNIAEKEGEIQIAPNIEKNAPKESLEQAQKEFITAEKRLAASFLEAILPCYSASIYENNVRAEEKTRLLLEDQIRTLKNEIQIKQNLKGEFPTGWQDPKPDVNLVDFDRQAKQLIAEVQGTLQNKESTVEELWVLLKKCDALFDQGTDLLLDSNAELGKMTDPIQQLGFRLAKIGGSIFDLKEESRKLTYLELKEKTDLLLKILALSEPKIRNPQLTDAIHHLQQELTEVQGQIEKFETEYSELLEAGLAIPEQALDDALEPYNKGISAFMSAVDQQTVKDSIKPYEMNIIQRILNVITWGHLFSEERKYENSTLNMKNELLKMKNEYDQEAPSDEKGLQI